VYAKFTNTPVQIPPHKVLSCKLENNTIGVRTQSQKAQRVS
jgi:hypothetical protein